MAEPVSSSPESSNAPPSRRASRRAPRRAATTTPSSSAPVSPGSTCSTACAAWASRSASTSWAPASAAPGSGTATRARAATSRAWSTRTSSRRSSSRSGSGASATPRSPRSCATSTTSPTASTCAATSSSRPASSAATFDESTGRWDVMVRAGGDAERVTAQHVVLATGCLSVRNTPKFPGLDNFQGPRYHTGNWPHAGVDFTGKRVAIIGTGSSAVQSIPIIAEQAAHLYVFQRTPNYSIPARNEPLDPEEVKRVKADYDALRQRASQVGFGIDLAPRDRAREGRRPEERRARVRGALEEGRLRLPRRLQRHRDRRGGQRSRRRSSCARRSARWSRTPRWPSCCCPRPPSAASACASTPTTSRPSTGPTSP